MVERMDDSSGEDISKLIKDSIRSKLLFSEFLFPKNDRAPVIEGAQNRVPQLEDLCVPVIGDGIKKSLYRNIDFKLDTPTSNKIFKSFHPHFPLHKDQMREIEQKFDITEMIVGRNICLDFAKMSASQRIRKLEILDLNNSSCPYLIPPKIDVLKENTAQHGEINGTELLSNLMNAESDALLESLSICGNGLRFFEEWSFLIPMFSPNISNLDLNGCLISNKDMRFLCELTNLVKLGIGQTEVNSLRGIGVAHKLTFLSLEGLKFNGPEDLEDLRLLQNLEYLDISFSVGEDKSMTAVFLAFCEGTLPKLKFLDCSGNDLTIEVINKLLSQHPNIEEISLINTAFDRNINFDEFSRKVKCFSLTFFSSCIEALMFYIDNAGRCKPILSRTLNFIDYEMEALSIEDVRKCAELLAALLKNPRQDFENQLEAIRCLYGIVNDYVWFPQLGDDLRREMIEAVSLAVVNVLPLQQFVGDKTVLKIAKMGLRFLMIEDLFNNTNAEKIACSAYMLLLICSGRYSHSLLVSSFEFLAWFPDTIESIGRSTNEGWSRFTKAVFDCGQTLCCRSEDYEYYLALLKMFSRFHIDEDIDHVISIIFSKLRGLSGPPVAWSLWCLDEMYPDLSTKQIDNIYTLDNIKLLWKILMNGSANNREETVKFLLSSYYEHFYRNKGGYISVPEHKSLIKEMITNLNKIRRKRRLPLTCGLQRLAKCVFKESKMKPWVNWLRNRISKDNRRYSKEFEARYGSSHVMQP